MFGPWKDESCETQIYAGLKPLQSTPFDQVVAELAEAKAGLVVAKTRSGNRANLDVRRTGRIGVAVFKAEIDHPADEQRMQIRIDIQCSRHDLDHHVECGHVFRVVHQGQVDELLDLAMSKQPPGPLEFSSRFLLCRMSRPLDAQMTEVGETDLDRAVHAIERRVQIYAQGGDGLLIEGREGV